MNDQPTPETDAESFSTAYQGELVYAEFARRLERERDYARSEVTVWRNKWEYATETAAKAENELNEAREALEFRRELYQFQNQLLKKCRKDKWADVEKLDRLADAMTRIVNYQGRFGEDDPRGIAEDALTTLDQPKP
jgi:hypothetical protein